MEHEQYQIPSRLTDTWLKEQCQILRGSGVIRCDILGQTEEERQIPLFRFGTGKHKLLYVGGHHAMEWLTAAVLFWFLADLGRYADKSLYGMDLGYLAASRTLSVVPLLNVDGALLQSGAAGTITEEKRRMNGGDDFVCWQANARGVDLNHNYRIGFAAWKAREGSMGITGPCPSRFSGSHPESEKETQALTAYIRREMPEKILTLHTQGEELYAPKAKGREKTAENFVQTASRLTGYRLATPTGSAMFGGLADWAAEEMGIPTLTLECGKGKNPLPAADAVDIYIRLRRFLLTALVL